MDGDGRFAAADYDSDGGQTVSIRAESAGGALDLVLELLDPDGHSLAYVDAPDLESPGIVRVALDAAGIYTVRVGTFNGEGSGDVSVKLTVDAPLVITPETESLRVPLGRSEAVEIALEGFQTPDTQIEIVVRDPRGLLDPYLMLIDETGALLAFNDDHHSPDPALNRFDSRMSTAFPDGAQLRITEFLGREGWLELLINP